MKKIIIILILSFFIFPFICSSEDILMSNEAFKNAFLKQKQDINEVIDSNNRELVNLLNESEKIFKNSMYESSWDSMFDNIYGQPRYGSRRARDRQDKENRIDDKFEAIRNKMKEIENNNDQLKIKKDDLELKVIEKFGSLPDWWKNEKTEAEKRVEERKLKPFSP